MRNVIALFYFVGSENPCIYSVPNRKQSYDEEYDDYICEMDLDEDEMVRFLTARADSCPYWRPGDEYITARKQ